MTMTHHRMTALLPLMLLLASSPNKGRPPTTSASEIPSGVGGRGDAHEYEALPSGGYVVRKAPEAVLLSMEISPEALRESAETLSRVGRWAA